MEKILTIFVIIATLIGAYLYYNEYRTPVQFEDDPRSERCIKHTREFGEDYYSDSYLDRFKNVFRRCPKIERTDAKEDVNLESFIPQTNTR